MSTKKVMSDKPSVVPVDSTAPSQATPDQLRKFQDAARALGTDDDPERFKERVRKLARAGSDVKFKTVKSSDKDS